MTPTKKDRDILEIQIVRLDEALKYISLQIIELKKDLSSLADINMKLTEEIKDCFYISETNRKSIEDLMSSVSKELNYTKEQVETFRKVINQFDERKDKKNLNLIQIAVTLAALIVGVILEVFYKVSGRQ